MTPHDSFFEPDVEALLARGRIVKPVPDVVRARSLARARAAVTAAVTPMPEPIPSPWRRFLPVAIAASLALAIGAAGAVAALHRRVPLDRAAPPLPRPAPAVHVRAPATAAQPTLAIAPPDDAQRKPKHSGQPASPQESYAAELGLLQRAQVAYAGRDFSAALALVAEHGRRFPSGRLAEEREALRVRSLAGSGRREEAARAVAVFAERFPRSVLLPRLSRELRE